MNKIIISSNKLSSSRIHSEIKSFANSNTSALASKFELVRQEDKIIVDRAFVRSLVLELDSHPVPEEIKGTILLDAVEIFLDPAWVLNYNGTTPDVRFPARYHLTIVADRFDSRGGKIDLTTGFIPSTPDEVSPAPDGLDCITGGVGIQVLRPSTKGTDGGPGEPGRTGGHGPNIKIFCEELVNIEIISNGGQGGMGGTGQRGGNGGKGIFIPVPGAPFELGNVGGVGGIGGTGGKGGNGGQIELFYSRKTPEFIVTDHLISNGGPPGAGGLQGSGGIRGFPCRPEEDNAADDGVPGSPGMPGDNSIPVIEQLEPGEFWKKVAIELEIPEKEPGEQ